MLLWLSPCVPEGTKAIVALVAVTVRTDKVGVPQGVERVVNVAVFAIDDDAVPHCALTDHCISA